MHWMGKFVGAALGFAVLGPAGSVLGALVGHHVDARYSSADARRIQQLFFEVSFELMGRVAKLDGRVSESEIRSARQVMDSMHLTPEQVRAAIERFTEGKRADYGLDRRTSELAEAFGGRRDLARTFVQLQVQAAIGSGEFTAAKRRLLSAVARELGLREGEVERIEATVMRQRGAGGGASALTLEDAYRALAVDPSASDGDIKTAYRRLMNRHHPDKLVAKGLPASMIDVAEQKTHEVRAAYERIKAHRGFK